MVLASFFPVYFGLFDLKSTEAVKIWYLVIHVMGFRVCDSSCVCRGKFG